MVDFGKRLALGCLVALGFFALVEGILMVTGVVPLYERADPYVGFAGYSPLFVEDTSPGGEPILRTASNKLQWFNAQQFPARKSSAVIRIFCLGGSTTYGRPYDDGTSYCGWLRAFLPAVDPSRQWEVINAGGVSYASYRIARLMEEIVDLEPDLVIVYPGHNEFLEKRTYGKLLDTPEFVRDVASVASRTRLYSLMSDFTYDQGDVLSTEVQAVLDRSVGPEEYRRDDEMRDAVLEHFRTSLERIAQLVQRAGAQMILITPASNVRDFSPFKSEPGAALTEEEVRDVKLRKLAAKAAISEGDPTTGASLTEQALSIDARDPELLFLHGKALHALGRIDEAHRFLVAARDEDIAPLRALTPIVEIVAEVSRDRDTGFVDFVHMLEEESSDGIPGSEMFLDHVHPTIERNRTLALALVDEMIDRAIVSAGPGWNDEIIAEISDRVEGSLDEQAHVLALKKLSNVLLWAGKVDEADRLRDQAGATAWDDVNTRLQKAMLLRKSGRIDEALMHYREAIGLSPGNPLVRMEYGVFLSELGNKAEASGELEKAVELDAKLPGVHYELGVVLKALGEVDRAIAEYRTALQLNPNNADAYNNLGVIEAQRGDLAAAADLFARALQADPAHENAAENLALARNAMQE